jgi:His-Xaa-Ser system protein HxsD
MVSNEREIDFDRQVFEIEAIQKAAYRFIDRMSVKFDVGETRIRCTLCLDAGEKDANGLVQNFHKEVLDQHLRMKIASETESIRHLILAHAFSRTGLT